MSRRPRILVTGANGFLGRAVVREAIESGLDVTAAVRSTTAPGDAHIGAGYVEAGDIHASTDWRAALSDIDFVIHTAGVTQAASREDLTKINVQGSENLARQSREAGVKRLVFVSSLGVHGASCSSRPVRSTDTLAPHDAYTASKAEAETRLKAALHASATEWVIVRPPLVYGAGAGGTIRRVEQLLRARIPLPLAALVNRRSVIGVRNLAHFLVHSLRETQAASNAWLVSDERDYTSLELFQMVAHNRGYPCRAFRCPEAWIRWLGSAVGRRREVDQLTRSLYIDRSAVLEALHWSAPYSVERQWQ